MCVLHTTERIVHIGRGCLAQQTRRYFSTYYLSYQKQITRWQKEALNAFFFAGLFPQKSPIITGYFADIDLQVTASYATLPPCTGNRVKACLSFFNRVLEGFAYAHVKHIHAYIYMYTFIHWRICTSLGKF